MSKVSFYICIYIICLVYTIPLLCPSLPTDVKYNQNTGISFICDLNDNVKASWPTTSPEPASSCNKIATKIPAIPKATSAQSVFDRLYDLQPPLDIENIPVLE